MAHAINRQPPYIQIIEEPAPRSVRFRYQSEGRPSSNLVGVNSTKANPTYPKIRVVGLRTIASVVVCCVTKDEPYWVHPHSLLNGDTEHIGEEHFPGIINAPVNPHNPEVTFSTLKLQCASKEEAKKVLETRATFILNPFHVPVVEAEINTIDLNTVRLCFQVVTENKTTGKPQILCSAISEPIYDKKKYNVLEIYRLTTQTGSAAGGTELTLLCRKVTRSDIQVRFFEEKKGRVVWQTFADPKYLKFFKQISIKLRTPAYHDVNIIRPVLVSMQLVRRSDNEVSEPIPFQFEPLACNKPSPPRKQNAAVMNLLKRYNCGCIPHPILHPDCKIHSVQKENRVNANQVNIMDERIPEDISQNCSVPLLDVPQLLIDPNINAMSNLNNESFYRKSQNMPGSSQSSRKPLVPSTSRDFPRPAQTRNIDHLEIIKTPLIRSLRKNINSEDPIMSEISSTNIVQSDLDAVYNNLLEDL